MIQCCRRSDSLPNIGQFPAGKLPSLPLWLPWTMCGIPAIVSNVSSNPRPKLNPAIRKEFRLHRQKLHEIPSHTDKAAKKLASTAWTLVHCIASRTRCCRSLKWFFETMSELCNWVPLAIQTWIAGNSSNSGWFTHSWGFPIRFQPSYSVNQSVASMLSCHRPNIWYYHNMDVCCKVSLQLRVIYGTASGG